MRGGPAGAVACSWISIISCFLLPPPPSPSLQQVLVAILDGLADEAEGVRDAALAAGRVAVELYANTALPLLLPAVEAAIISGNWRIRQSSVELLGDLLFKARGACFERSLVCTAGRVSSAASAVRGALRARPTACRLLSLPPPLHQPQVAGTTGRIQQDLSNEEEEGISAEAHGAAIVEALGQDK